MRVCVHAHRRNPDAFGPPNAAPPYTLSQPVPANAALSAALLSSLQRVLGEGVTAEGLNASADSFYSSQVGVSCVATCALCDYMCLVLCIKQRGMRNHLAVYASKPDIAYQGRPSGDFDDRNEHVLTDLLTAYPSCSTMEMETFHLLDLARCSRGRVCLLAAKWVAHTHTVGHARSEQRLRPLYLRSA